jgi:hypothetical protein
MGPAVEQEACQAEEEQDGQDNRVIRQIAPEFRQLLTIASVNGHHQADQEQQTEEIYDQLVDDVKGSLIEADTEIWASDISL